MIWTLPGISQMNVKTAQYTLTAGNLVCINLRLSFITLRWRFYFIVKLFLSIETMAVFGVDIDFVLEIS